MRLFRRKCEGVALITVLMVMVVLGLMAAYMAESLGSSYSGASLAQLTAQTETAASSGLEWGRNRALGSGLCGSNQFQVGSVTVDVTCAAQSVQEDTSVYAIYTISADARHGSYGNWDHVRRARSGVYSSR